MAKQTYEERIAELRKKQEELKAQEKALLAKVSEKRRKEDTRAKIKLGGDIVMVLRDAGFEIDAVDIPEDKLIQYLKSQEERGGFLSRSLGLVKKEEANGSESV